MLLDISRSSRLWPLRRLPSGAARIVLTALMSVAVSMGSAGFSLAWAQSTPIAPAANATPAASPDNTTAGTDPVARFLLDKGLLQPVANSAKDVARHMRDKATDVASDLVLSAMNFLGVPYRRGGQSAETGFDCSGFTRYVFENSVGLVLPRRAEEQARAPGMLAISRDELKPGDLVFFNTLRRTFSHVGIYVGDNKFIHSPRAGGEVRIEDMNLSYWTRRYNGARRAPTVEPANASTDTPAPH